MKFIKISKFILPNKTFRCGYCWDMLDVISVDINPRHFFNPGQHYSCSCGTSQVWANSVRYLEDLEKYCDGIDVNHTKNPETHGFCNDSFCGKCWSHLYPLKNGQLILDGKKINYKDLDNMNNIQELVDSKRLMKTDIYGCLKCIDNNFLIHGGYSSEGGEIDGQEKLAKWYKAHQYMWRDK